MTHPSLKQELVELLDVCFDSADALEVLFALRSDTDRWWSTPELLQHLSLERSALARALAELQERGLALQLGADHFCSAPLEATAQAAMGALEHTYREDKDLLLQHFSKRPPSAVVG